MTLIASIVRQEYACISAAKSANTRALWHVRHEIQADFCKVVTPCVCKLLGSRCGCVILQNQTTPWIIQVTDSCQCLNYNTTPDGRQGAYTGFNPPCCTNTTHFNIDFLTFEQLAHPDFGFMNIQFRCDMSMSSCQEATLNMPIESAHDHWLFMSIFHSWHLLCMVNTASQSNLGSVGKLSRRACNCKCNIQVC